MSDFKPRSSLDLAEKLEELSGGLLTEDEATRMAIAMWDDVVRDGVVDRMDWDMFLTLAVRFMQPGALGGGPPPPDPPAPTPPASPSAPLWDYLAELFRQAETELPMPPNPFHVTRRADNRVLFIVPSHILSDGEAVNLAVWLLAVADPKLEAFGPMFAKVGGF